MKTLFNTLTIVLLTILLPISACKDDDNIPKTPDNPAAEMIKIGETYLVGANAKAVAFVKESLTTGYNTIYFALTDSTDGSALNHGHFDVTPTMDMGGMVHGAPVENSESSEAVNGYFESSVVFTMPGSAEMWSLEISFHNHKTGYEGFGDIGVEVAQSAPNRLISTSLANDTTTTIFMSIVVPTKFKIGINDIEFSLHSMKSMMEFPPVEDLSIEIEPYMPSMEHGSPNNVHPVHISDGHYQGKVNFTMSGLWHVRIRLYKDGILQNEGKYFEVTI